MTGYTIYIEDGAYRAYLSDWIICDDINHLVFRGKEHAMIFPTFQSALQYRQRLTEMKYRPHIEDWGERATT